MLCFAVAAHCFAMLSLCFAMLCRCSAVHCHALPLRVYALHCLATLRPCSAALCHGYALLRLALPSQCSAMLRFASAAPCIALAQLIAFWQYADFLSACVRLSADLLRVKRLADRAFLHLADYVPPLDAVGHRRVFIGSRAMR